GHHALMVGADVEPADVVTHDDEDVGRPLLLLRECLRARRRHCDETRKQTEAHSSRAHVYSSEIGEPAPAACGSVGANLPCSDSKDAVRTRGPMSRRRGFRTTKCRRWS